MGCCVDGISEDIPLNVSGSDGSWNSLIQKKGIKIVRADVGDVVRIPDRHVDKCRFVSIKFECQLFLCADPADFNYCMTFDDRKTLDFCACGNGSRV